MLLGYAGLFNLGFGHDAGKMLLVGAQLFSGWLGACSRCRNDICWTISSKKLLPCNISLFKQSLAQLDVRFHDVLDRTRPRLGHVIQESYLGVQMCTNCGSDRLGK